MHLFQSRSLVLTPRGTRWSLPLLATLALACGPTDSTHEDDPSSTENVAESTTEGGAPNLEGIDQLYHQTCTNNEMCIRIKEKYGCGNHSLSGGVIGCGVWVTYHNWYTSSTGRHVHQYHISSTSGDLLLGCYCS
jgi:hypothetical protein